MLNSTLRDDRGMTLIEIMMALAVFGIVMITFISAVRGFSRITADNLDQLRMIELARVETEKYKAGIKDSNFVAPSNDPNKDYSPLGTPEQKYGIRYQLSPSNGGQMLTVTVGPAGSIPDPTDPESYVLVSWLPSLTPAPPLTQQYGQIRFVAANYTVDEDDSSGRATITVERINGSVGTVTVNYATNGGTATVGTDYTAASGTLTFNDGDTGPKTFTIPITNDLWIEGNETINLTLSNPIGGATLGNRSTAVLTIIDDDTISIHPEDYITYCANISFANNAKITGDILTGNGSPLVTVSNGTELYGNVYVNTNLQVDNNCEIGSAAQPRNLVVNGSVTLSNNSNVYGNLYLSGQLTSANQAKVDGTIITGPVQIPQVSIPPLHPALYTNYTNITSSSPYPFTLVDNGKYYIQMSNYDFHESQSGKHHYTLVSTGNLEFPNNFTGSGVIFAPQGTVTFGNNCSFTGIIVAKNIIVRNNCVLTYQKYRDLPF